MRKNAALDTVAIATAQVRTRLDEGDPFDPRIIAIGLIRVSTSAEGEINFDIDAVCVDPADPSEENATTLAKWLLGHSHEKARMVSWRVHDPLLAGINDIACKIAPGLARDLMAMLEEWGAVELVDLSTALGEPGATTVDKVAQAQNIDVISMDRVMLERTGWTHRAYVRDIVATAAMANWRLWSLHAGEHLDAHEAAIATLMQWRQQNAAH